jgi:uncharacterized membrane-anchored protein YhcB (DUF1043 family)
MVLPNSADAINAPIWIAVIGVVGVVIGVVLTNLFAQAHDRKKVNERCAITKADMLARLKTHCADLRPILLNPPIDPDRWQAAHDKLEARAQGADVIEALGAKYDSFMKAVHSEAKAILIQRNAKDRIEAYLHEHTDDRNPVRKWEINDFYDYTTENVADVIIAYAPFIDMLGDAETSNGLLKAASEMREVARLRRSQLPGC